MTELENLRNQKFALECKDHWTEADWKEDARLQKRLFELDPPECKPQKWVKIIKTFPNGFRYDYEGKIFEKDSPVLMNFIATNNIINYELKEV